MLSRSNRPPRRPSPRPPAACGLALALALGSVLFLGGTARAAGASFTPIGDLPGGVSGGTAVAVSADGSVVVGASSSANGDEAVRWTRSGGLVGLGDLPGGVFRSEADGVSADGNVIVGAGNVGIDAALRQAYRWTPATGMVGLGYLPGGGTGATSFANEVNPAGTVVVGLSSSATGPQAFRWTADAGMVGLGRLPGHQRSTALGVSGDGNVVVGSSLSTSTGETRGFRWTPGGGMVALAPLADDAHSAAARVSADGSVIVGASQTTGADRQAVRWVGGGTVAVPLGPVAAAPGAPPRLVSDAVAVSDDGSVIVGIADSSAFVWDAVHGARDLKTLLASQYGLDLSGWRLAVPWDVSADGSTIVGVGADRSGNTIGWVVVLPVPEPGAATGLVAGLAPLLLRRRRGHLR